MVAQHFAALISDQNKFRRHLLIRFFISLGAAVLAVVFLDQKMGLYFMQPLVKESFYQSARTWTDLGLFEPYIIIAVASWVGFKLIIPKIESLRDYKILEYLGRWGLNFIVALLVSGILTHIIKFLVGRQRPHQSPDFYPLSFEPFNTHWYFHSFSSGHSQVAFTAATMFAVLFPKMRWVFYTLAVSICVTRVIVHDHFVSDIIFGAFVGYAGALISLKWMSRTKNSLFHTQKIH